MITTPLLIASALGHVAARVLVMSLVLSLVATFALTGALTIVSVLDVTFSFLEAVQDSAIATTSLTSNE